MTTWEYLIIALPTFETPTRERGESAAVQTLDDLGEQGWEAVSMTVVVEGNVIVLLKRPKLT
jgi:hypothetical protein